MKILYIHGFGSHYDPTHEKIQELEKIGDVVGVDIDYYRGYESAFATAHAAIKDNHIDLIVGTSMGGYLAAAVGTDAGIPFVALNPAIEPKTSLLKWEGSVVDYTGGQHYLTRAAIDSYPDIATTGAGLILVESADEVIHAQTTVDTLSEFYQVKMFTGGSHRFTHMSAALPIITEFYSRASVSYES